MEYVGTLLRFYHFNLDTSTLSLEKVFTNSTIRVNLSPSISSIIIGWIVTLYSLQVCIVDLEMLLLLVEEIYVRGKLALQQRYWHVLHLIEVAHIGDIVHISHIDWVLLHQWWTSLAYLPLSIEHFTSDHWPSQQITVLIQGRKEAVFLAPDQVLWFVAHTDAIKQVEMG